MPFYFIYRITPGPSEMIKQLEKVERFDSYKEAKNKVKELRNEISSDSPVLYKIIFAENELQAEETLQEKREQPVVEEWEK